MTENIHWLGHDSFRLDGSSTVSFVELDGRLVSQAADTDAIPEMRHVRCDVSLPRANGTCVMTAEEAADAWGMPNAGVIVPVHWGEHVGTEDDARRFAGLCGAPATILSYERG
jgi:L-ascorbate metabolism protein UlaG (beta-lactamase superfamily)